MRVALWALLLSAAGGGGAPFVVADAGPQSASPGRGADTRIQEAGGTTTATHERLGEPITIPAGSFLMGNGGDEGYGEPAEMPQRPVYLPTYQIGKYEVTRGEYRRFTDEGGYQDPAYWSPEGWVWKESDAVVHSGRYGAVEQVERPDSHTRGGTPRSAGRPNRSGSVTDTPIPASCRPTGIRSSA